MSVQQSTHPEREPDMTANVCPECDRIVSGAYGHATTCVSRGAAEECPSTCLFAGTAIPHVHQAPAADRRNAVRAVLNREPWAAAVPVTDEMVDAVLAGLADDDKPDRPCSYHLTYPRAGTGHQACTCTH